MTASRSAPALLGCVLLAAACSSAGGGGPTLVCAAGQAACGQVCLDVLSDPSNCGGCGIPCASDQTCQAGVCQGSPDAGAPDGGLTTAALPLLITSAPGDYWDTAGQATEVSSGNADVTVRDDSPAQVWEGFGGAFNEIGWNVLSMLSPADRDRALQLLYGTDGAHFAFGRIPIGASDYAMDRYTDDEVPAGSQDPTLAAFSIQRDMQKLIPYVKAAQAVNPRVRLWASPWTPPTWMKQGPFAGNMMTPFDGGTFKTDAVTMGAFAQYLVDFVQAYAQQGIKLEAISAQNEPNYTGTYPTCGWSPGPYATFIGQYLGPAFAAAGLTTKIMLGTLNGGGSDPQILGTVMGNTAAAGYVKVLGFQWGMQGQVGNARRYNVPIWQTEHRCGNYPWQKPFDMTMAPNDDAYAVETWGLIRDWIHAGVTAYSAWNMVLDTVGVGIDSTRVWPQDALLTVDVATQTLIVTPAYHVFRHVSQFVPTGAHVVATSGGDALAFKNPDGTIVVVVHNAGGARTETVAVAGRKLQFAMPAAGWATLVTQ